MACQNCDPSLALATKRAGPNHYSAEFGDWDCTVSLNGERLMDCIEVMAGPGGYALRLKASPARAGGGPRMCKCAKPNVEIYRDDNDNYRVLRVHLVEGQEECEPT